MRKRRKPHLRRALLSDSETHLRMRKRSGKRKSNPEAYGRNGAEGAKGGNGYGREIAQEQCRTEEKLAKGRGEIIGYADIVTLIIKDVKDLMRLSVYTGIRILCKTVEQV